MGPSTAGILSTASGLVFASDADGNFIAIDGATGKHVWHFQTGSAIYAAPTTYMLGGRQYVVIPSGTTFFAFAGTCSKANTTLASPSVSSRIGARFTSR